MIRYQVSRLPGRFCGKKAGGYLQGTEGLMGKKRERTRLWAVLSQKEGQVRSRLNI